jgi:hypothetical protein
MKRREAPEHIPEQNDYKQNSHFYEFDYDEESKDN